MELDSGRLVFAPNLRWPEFDLRVPIEKACGLDVELENAANACALAAVWFDHMDSRNLVVVTVSEGIGTGILVNGRLARGQSGMAGEFGHVPLDSAGPYAAAAAAVAGRCCLQPRGFAIFPNQVRRYGLRFPDLLCRADQGIPRRPALETMADIWAAACG